MYLHNLTLLNSGPLNKLEFSAPFTADHNPKPIVFVGTNGSGKTTLLSVVADALIELATQAFRDISPSQGLGTSYFRIVGNRNIQVGKDFELSAVRFAEASTPLLYRAKAGKLDPHSVTTEMAKFPGLGTWKTDENVKDVVGDRELVRQIFNQGAYVFFPSTRFEVPHWLNTKYRTASPRLPLIRSFLIV